MPFSLSGMKQKELCSWIWVWVRGSVCVYTCGGSVVCTMWQDHLLLCRTVHGVYKRCEWGQRKLPAMLICSTRVACAVEVNAAKYCLSIQLMAPKKLGRKVKKSIIQGHVEGSLPKRETVYFSSRQAPSLNCFCIAQFPPDGKLDGKSMKHKTQKHLNHNNKRQTLS